MKTEVNRFLYKITEILSAHGFQFFVWEVDSRYASITVKKSFMAPSDQFIKREYPIEVVRDSSKSLAEYEAEYIMKLFDEGKYYKPPEWCVI